MCVSALSVWLPSRLLSRTLLKHNATDTHTRTPTRSPRFKMMARASFNRAMAFPGPGRHVCSQGGFSSPPSLNPCDIAGRLGKLRPPDQGEGGEGGKWDVLGIELPHT
jgi:hypothetical protein